jgi:tRNA dimethylallyltransferase
MNDTAWTRNCWFLTGPTASGKSSAGLLLAEQTHAEIISLDSMALYRTMDIGTAKPTCEDRRRVRHHLIDILDPSEPSTVADYLRRARSAVEDIEQRGHRALFVGGTPLFLKIVLRGMFDGPPASAELRHALEMEAEQIGTPALHERLSKVDPIAGARIMPNDRRRIIRALEVFETTGKPIGAWQTQFACPASPSPKVLCLDWPRDQLRQRIADRVDAMLAGGWIEETRRLFERVPPPGREARQAVGYSEIRQFLDGKISYSEMMTFIINRTRQFAKRQMTWFRHLAEIQFVATHQDEPLESLVDRLRCQFES